MPRRLSVGIIGAGISGLSCARFLDRQHDVTLIEAADYIGGHTNTVDVKDEERELSVDTGFIVFNDRTYPNFRRLLAELKIRATPTSMSFSVRSDRDRVEYNGTSLNGVFGQRRNLFRPAFLRMLAQITRFNKEGTRDSERELPDETVADYLDRNRYGREFRDWYLLPMGAAIWSCPTGTFGQFPIRFVIRFCRNHGLLSLTDRPQWFVVNGGSRTYVNALLKELQAHVRLNSPVSFVRRHSDKVSVTLKCGEQLDFDEVIFACHSDQALSLLGNDALPAEREVLSAVPYQPNIAVLHTDRSVLPTRRRCIASWNYRIRNDPDAPATVTYHMNTLQHLGVRRDYCVTLNDESSVRSDLILGRYEYSHPVFSLDRDRAVSRHRELLRQNRTSFCGAYWGNGFHEDGVNSALAVFEAYHPGQSPWRHSAGNPTDLQSGRPVDNSSTGTVHAARSAGETVS